MSYCIIFLSPYQNLFFVVVVVVLVVMTSFSWGGVTVWALLFRKFLVRVGGYVLRVHIV